MSTGTISIRMVAAYLLDRADQYETESPCWIALADAAQNIMNGEVAKAWRCGELDDLFARVDGLKDGSRAREVNPRLGVDDALAERETKGCK